jgi:hypothetical protein
MNKREQYIARVEEGILFYEKMDSLKKDKYFRFNTTNKNGKPVDLKLTRHNEKDFSVSENQLVGSGLSIDMEKSGKSALHCYTFDLFGNKTYFNIPFDSITYPEDIKVSEETETPAEVTE